MGEKAGKRREVIQTNQQANASTFAPHISQYSDHWPTISDVAGGRKTVNGNGTASLQNATHFISFTYRLFPASRHSSKEKSFLGRQKGPP